MTELEARICDVLEEKAAAHGTDIVDVEITGEGGSTHVCVRVDRADITDEPITLDEVAKQSAWIEAVLDELDPIPSAYTLEVSSPGLARPLRKARDFERFVGETVKLETVTGERRRYTGELRGIKDGVVTIAIDNSSLDIAFDNIKKCTIKPDYDFLLKGEKRKS